MFVEKPLLTFLFVALYGLSLAVAGRPELTLFALAIPLIWLSVTDFCSQIIPDSATVAVALLGLASHDLGTALAIDLAVSVTVMAVLWAASEVVWRRKRHEALGLGDVKLISAAVLCVGAAQIWLAVLIASLGGIVAVLIMRFRGGSKESGVPFGPFIAYGLFLTILISRAE